ncbi:MULTISPECIES: response regulator transcription factor [Pandoraea]|uniref:Chemotaxis protein CheY n=2 Tax=Pandoraea TaxID=93217 RepID=A0A0B5F2C7_9BURK|nr:MULTISPECIES: response regulator transcription factor [Pandoraea]AJE97495.1 chemotaxis protein CheY [Pandoraea apista]AKH71468.1 chemotaxis protein CheY [Pandoraea apista]AKI63741.1 chemotaxis protein CheY [Pandoraea apista]ALS67154.1 DNA-binding response regulator [Pandoraea apista]AVF42133.1 DNA-binding response regulator [Pandoraea apista]
MRIMLVEDTADVAEAIATQLRRLGHALDCESDGAAAAARIGDDYDLLILDVMLPHVDGFELLKRVRERGLSTRVLMLTACAEIEERVRALDLGADDYLTKPFDFRELEARVRALMRRTGQDATNRLTCANLSLDRKSRGVEIDGQPIELTRREVTLLEILAARPGRIFGKDELMDRLYGDEPAPNANAIEQYVARLRKKLAAAQFQIRTLRGLGYQLVLS